MTMNTKLTVITVTDKPLYVHYVQENGGEPIFNPWLFSEKKPTIKNKDHKRFLLKKWYRIPSYSGVNPKLATVQGNYHQIEFKDIYNEVCAITGIAANIKEIRGLDKVTFSYVTDRIARATIWHKNTCVQESFRFRPSYEDGFAFFVKSDLEEIEITDKDLTTLSKRAKRNEQRRQVVIDKANIISNLLKPNIEDIANKWGFAVSKDGSKLWLDFSSRREGLWKLIEATIAKDLQGIGISLDKRDFIKNKTSSWNGKVDILNSEIKI